MANVVGIRGTITPPGQANDEVVQVLARWLELALDGVIIAISLQAVRANGGSLHNWVCGEHATQMIGIMECAKADLVAGWLSQTSCDPLPELGGDDAE